MLVVVPAGVELGITETESRRKVDHPAPLRQQARHELNRSVIWQSDKDQLGAIHLGGKSESKIGQGREHRTHWPSGLASSRHFNQLEHRMVGQDPQKLPTPIASSIDDGSGDSMLCLV